MYVKTKGYLTSSCFATALGIDEDLRFGQSEVRGAMVVSSNSKKVCVVGAGVAGLAAARELLQDGHDVTVMEQSRGVGGQWLFDAVGQYTQPRLPTIKGTFVVISHRFDATKN